MELIQEDQAEQEIIRNIRKDLENHKRSNVNSGSVDESINYKDKTVAGEKKNEGLYILQGPLKVTCSLILSSLQICQY